ncbi:MAG: hypothetical protein A2077_00290 [Nitrospirae bacterium GWC2_46_6]|nr:MAG: hypothetical protein A2077_00290 [Nitrospirae bacterium GWC2_46_6]
MNIGTTRKIQPDDIKLQAAIDVAGVMFVVIGADQNVALINKRGCEILGYKKEEILGRNWFDIFIPDRIRDGMRAIWEMLTAQEIEPLEYFENPILTKDGSERIILWRNAVLRDDNGSIFGTLSSGEDITDQKNLDYQMRKLSMAVEQSPTAILVTDNSGVVEYVNPSFTHLTGYEAEEVTGGECPILFSKEMPDDICRDIWKNITNGDTWRGEFLNRKKSGESFWAGISIAPIKGYDGRITHHVTFMRDITDLKLLEEERHRQTEKMAVVGRLAAGVAHEINNPLSGIILCLNKLTKPNVDDSTKESLTHAVDGGLRKIKKIVEQLLDFSRTTVTERTPKNPNKIIDHLLPLLDYQASKNNITISKKSGNVPEIPVDENKLGQVFVNLILNAIQAMPGGGTLTIETALEQDFCVIYIKDTGAGIPESVMPYIFDPFFTTKEVGEGTGLGLSISKSIIEQHGGAIAVESIEGAGATFKIKLPIIVG